MFKIGIRLMATRSVRNFRATLSAASQTSRPFLGSPPWGRSSNRKERLSSPLRALSVVALTSGSGVHVRADSSEKDAVVPEQQPVTDENDGSVDITSEAGTKRSKGYVLDILETILYKLMDSKSRMLLYGVMGANVAIYSGFTLGYFLNRPPKPNPTLLRFLSRNFLLSIGWLRRGRWHVMLTSMFVHSTLRHLIMNTFLVFIGMWLCSDYLDVWQIAGLYFGGGLVGRSASMTLTKILRNRRDMIVIMGGSDGNYALLYYYVCAQDLELSSMPSVPFEHLAKALFLYFFVSEGVELSKFIRYGDTGRGPKGARIDHAAHLGGAVTGVLAYGVSRLLEDMRSNVSSSDDNKRKGQEEMTENMQEATSVARRV